MPEQHGRAERKADHDHKLDEQAGISDGVQHGKPMGAVMLAGRPDCGGGPWLGSACECAAQLRQAWACPP